MNNLPPNSNLNQKVSHVDTFFQALPQPANTYMATYVFLGDCDKNVDLRSKTRTLHKKPNSIADFSVWNFDGSSCGLATTAESEVWMQPVFFCLDPFQPTGQNYLVLCENVEPTGSGKPFNKSQRSSCAVWDEKMASEEFQFGIEQEFFFMSPDDPTLPLGWTDHAGTGMVPAGSYYCGVGTSNAVARQVLDSHYRACLYAGLNIHGTNLEVAPSQAEYQIGPCNAIETADQLWMSRYILLRVAEMYGVNISFDPKPVPTWSGSGCHTNISTKKTRTPGTGFDAILSYMPKFEKHHKENLATYGSGNEKRLTGLHETQHMDKFSYGVGDRGSSIRLTTQSKQDKCGYFELRLVSANCDPYKVLEGIYKTCADQ